MKRILIITLLCTVAAEEEARALAGEKCTKKSGNLCLNGLRVVHVTGDLQYWTHQGGASKPISCISQTKQGNLDISKDKFCGEIAGDAHELIAPRFARRFVKDAGFKRGSCKRYGKETKHSVKMTVPDDPEPEDCYCENTETGCYCPCNCENKGAVGLLKTNVGTDKKKARDNQRKKRIKNKSEPIN